VHILLNTAVILAGGKGTRLRPLTYSVPKPLVPVDNKPAIEYIIELLIKYGISKAVVAVNYLGDMIREYFSSREFKGIDIHVPLINSLDTADAVRKCHKYIDDDFFVVMGDVLTDMNLKNFGLYHYLKKGIATIALIDVENPLEYGLTIVDRDMRIRGFVEKPTSIEAYMVNLAYAKIMGVISYRNYVNSGFYAFDYSIVDIIRENLYLMDWSRHVFPFLLEEEYKLYGWDSGDVYWLDIGRPETYLRANRDIMDLNSGSIRPSGVEIERRVWIGEETKISSSVNIIPPVVIGNNVYIGSDSIIGPYTVIGNNSYIESKSRIRESIIWDHVNIEENVEIESSIIANNVWIGKNAKIMPLSVIGGNVKIEPFGVVDERSRVKPGEVVYAKKVIEVEFK